MTLTLQLSSFPNVQGLFLILKSTGFLTTTNENNKIIFTVDPFYESKWNTANELERYVNLLIALLFYSNIALISKQAWQMDEPLSCAGRLLKRINSLERLNIANYKDQQEFTYSMFGQIYCALMRMFCLVEIEDNVTEPDKGWLMKSITITEIGKSLCNILDDLILIHTFADLTDENFMHINVAKINTSIKKILPGNYNFFLAPRQYEKRHGIHLLRFSLGKNFGAIWLSMLIQPPMN